MSNEDFETIKTGLTKLSDASLDASMVEKIKKWSIPFKAIEILEVLDLCVFSALASGGIIAVLQLLLKNALEAENITHDELVKQAVWRKTV